MKKRNEQKILTMIIVLAVIALVILVGSIIYEEQIQKNKKVVESIYTLVSEESKKNTKPVQIENEEIIEETVEDIYVGEEEKETNDVDKGNQAKSNDEKAIDLAKKEWGEDDSVTFNIEEKKGIKYYIAVKQEATVIGWYEVDIENWKISEY